MFFNLLKILALALLLHLLFYFALVLALIYNIFTIVLFRYSFFFNFGVEWLNHRFVFL